MVKIILPHEYVAVIDDEDEERVRQHRWRPLVQRHTVYAIARLPRLNGKQRSIYMHRLIVEAKPGERIAHRNSDGLLNARRNLVVHTPRKRGMVMPPGGRRSKYAGVSWDAEAGRWAAVCHRGRKATPIGLYATEEGAARASDMALYEDLAAAGCGGLAALLGANFPELLPGDGQ